jgi:hypothetical protein
MNDAIFHPFDMEGRRHMEYIADHGSFADLPYDRIIESFLTCYGGAAENHQNQTNQTGDFEREAELEQ